MSHSTAHSLNKTTVTALASTDRSLPLADASHEQLIARFIHCSGADCNTVLFDEVDEALFESSSTGKDRDRLVDFLKGYTKARIGFRFLPFLTTPYFGECEEIATCNQVEAYLDLFCELMPHATHLAFHLPPKNNVCLILSAALHGASLVYDAFRDNPFFSENDEDVAEASSTKQERFTQLKCLHVPMLVISGTDIKLTPFYQHLEELTAAELVLFDTVELPKLKKLTLLAVDRRMEPEAKIVAPLLESLKLVEGSNYYGDCFLSQPVAHLFASIISSGDSNSSALPVSHLQKLTLDMGKMTHRSMNALLRALPKGLRDLHLRFNCVAQSESDASNVERESYDYSSSDSDTDSDDTDSDTEESDSDSENEGNERAASPLQVPMLPESLEVVSIVNDGPVHVRFSLPEVVMNADGSRVQRKVLLAFRLCWNRCTATEINVGNCTHLTLLSGERDASLDDILSASMILVQQVTYFSDIDFQRLSLHGLINMREDAPADSYLPPARASKKLRTLSLLRLPLCLQKMMILCPRLQLTNLVSLPATLRWLRLEQIQESQVERGSHDPHRPTLFHYGSTLLSHVQNKRQLKQAVPYINVTLFWPKQLTARARARLAALDECFANIVQQYNASISNEH